MARVATLARVRLEPEEERTFRPQLERVLAYVAELQSVDTEGVEPTRHVTDIAAPLRSDVEQVGLDRDEVLAQAPSSVDGGFAVPKFVDSG